MTRRRLGPGDHFDRDGTLYVLRDNIARADAMITAAERLIDEASGGIQDDENENEDGKGISRRRNHLSHLIESAKLAVRAAIYAGIELDAELAKRPGAPRGR